MTKSSKYSRFLERIFPNLGTVTIEPDIRRIYGGQIGHLVFSPAKFVAMEEEGIPLLDLLNYSDGDESNIDSLENELLSAIKNSPHTFGLLESDLPTIEMHQSQYFRYSVNFDHPILFTVKVPSRKKSFDIEDDKIEQFDVLMAGSNCIAFVELDDCPRRMFIGHEFREQIRKHLDSETNKFRLGQVGPSPIHADFYIIDVQNEEQTEAEIFTYEDNIYVVINLELMGSTANDVYQDILNQSSFELDMFFGLSKSRSLLLDLQQAIHQKLQETVNSYIKLGSNLFFINFRKLTHLRMDLLIIHKASLDLEYQLSSFEKERKSFISKLDNHIFLEDLKEYFYEHTEPDVAIGNALFKTMEYIEKSISSVDVAIRTIFAAVIGASIGVFVTLLLKL